MNEDEREFRKIFAETAQSSLKALLVMSGGAAVSFLAFLGAILRDATTAETFKPAIEIFAIAMQSFVLGVAFCVLSFGFAFLSHACFHFKWEKTAWAFGFFCIFFWLACLGAFVFGSLKGVYGISEASAIFLK